MQSIRLGFWVLLLLAGEAAHGGINSWSARGPFGGPVYQLAVHPSQPNLAFAVANSGLYRTTDGGDTWSRLVQLTPFFANYGAVQFDPANPNRIYAIARDSGLWRSTDGGDTFVNISPLLTSDPSNYAVGLAISADGNTIYYSTSGQQLFRSTDGGASFSERPRMPAPGHKLVVDPANSLRVYAGRWNNALMRSEDGGNTWIDLAPTRGVADFAVTPGSPNILWVNGTDGLYRKPDDGSAWPSSPLFPGYTVHSDPAVPSVLYASPTNGVGFVRRYSAGSWTTLSTLPALLNTVAIAASNTQSVLAGTGAGVFRSDNGGATWARSDDGLDANYVRHLATGAGRVYASTEHVEIGIGDADEGTLQRSRVAGPMEPDLAISAVGAHPTDPNVILAGTHTGVYYSFNGGASWNPGQATLVPTRIDAFAFDPQSPQNIYLALSPQGTSEAIIQRSTDGGATFTPVGGAGLNDVQATRLLVDPEDPSRMLLASVNVEGNNDGVFRSVDAGVTWNRVLASEGGFDIAINPANSSRMYALSAGAVHVSDNGGASFAPLPSFMNYRYGSPYSMVLDPVMPDVVYVLGTNFESAIPAEFPVMRSVDAGISWERMPSAPDFQWLPTRVAINAAAPTTVLVATGAVGVLSFDIAPDLEVRILDHADNRGSGAPNHFDVRVHNNGPLAATGVALDIHAPDGASDVSAELPGGTCTTTAARVQCSLPFVKLTSDATARVSYTLPAAAELNVRATVTARERDTVATNNTATGVETAPRLIDLIVTGSSSAATVSTNSAFALTFQVRNAGPDVSSSTRLSIGLEGGITITSVTPSRCSASGATVTCDFGAKASGESASVTVNATAAAAGTLLATAAAIHASDAVDANAANDSASVQVTSRSPGSGGGGGGGGGGGMSLHFVLCLALLALTARRPGRSCEFRW
ncbi:hypothetical protein JM946_14445 [Steroidobacter sp. S1-65]|uniref:DUF11 domain-containing protein n=1 Tax=Steroidobacter gossypii TaxID=2805490 RepID=A0ABS1WY79_9GAMM|nr:DUF11 domain-containing protein [Steroidobacter gossypii]MBM0105928.1 hypothetical protein [Steroidobacter gossypii]